MNDKIKVVLDTNILVSALWSENNNQLKIIELIPYIITPCINDLMLLEYNNVLKRPKFNFSPHKRKMLLLKIKEYSEIVLPNKSNIHMTDESDRIFYDTAKTSDSILITGNLKHFPNETFIMNSIEFLNKLNII